MVVALTGGTIPRPPASPKVSARKLYADLGLLLLRSGSASFGIGSIAADSGCPWSPGFR
jgi:hypothetical protein